MVLVVHLIVAATGLLCSEEIFRGYRLKLKLDIGERLSHHVGELAENPAIVAPLRIGSAFVRFLCQIHDAYFRYLKVGIIVCWSSAERFSEKGGAMQTANRVQRALRAGAGASFGAWQMLPGTNHARVMARSGFDWVCVDTEHGNIDGTWTAWVRQRIVTS